MTHETWYMKHEPWLPPCKLWYPLINKVFLWNEKLCRVNCTNCIRTFLPPTMKLGQGYVFTRVCDSVHRGGSASAHAGIHPPNQTTPGTRPSRPPIGPETPCEQTRPPQEQTPPSSACWEIGPASRWYASYWNAYLLELIYLTHQWH